MNVAAPGLPALTPLVAVALPLLGAALTGPLARAAPRVRTGVLASLCAGAAALSLLLIPGVLGGVVVEARIVQIMPELWLHLWVDAMGALFGATVTCLWLLALVYSHGYLAGRPGQTRYYAFFLLCLAFTLGVAYAGNLITLLVFYELFSVLTYALVVHDETPEAMAAGRKYLAYILFGGSLVILAVVFTYHQVGGGLTFGGEPLLTGVVGPWGPGLILGLFLVGFGVKAALFPLHGWVPDVHPAAPAPFSAILSGVMVAAGAFGLLRVVRDVFGPDLIVEMGAGPWVSGAAAFTVLFAAMLALGQDDLKRRLAWSTISQMGYVVLATFLLGAGAAEGGLVHLTHHAFMKGALFLCAGILIREAGIHRVSQMAGVARQMPWTMAAFSLAALGLIGTPPLSGFVSKWWIGVGMVEADQPLYLAVLLGGALLAAAYLMPIVYTAWFGVEEEVGAAGKEGAAGRGEGVGEDRAAGKEAAAGRGGAEGLPDRAEGLPGGAQGPPGSFEAPLSMLVPTLIAAGLTLILGLGAFLPGFPHSLARMAAEVFLGHPGALP